MVEIGDYIRTKNGYIGKLLKFAKDKDFFADIECDFILGGMPIKRKDILTHSKNIIDLIQEGDIIKYKNEKEYYKDEVWKINKSENIIYTTDGIEVNAKNIKAIVTKEQFEAMEYKVEE